MFCECMYHFVNIHLKKTKNTLLLTFALKKRINFVKYKVKETDFFGRGGGHN
uniref:Uncharacterized protein n=1 Tax=Lepeophtheirus salmonis TaxID=72036 RepID=A0A0K2U9R0_LEPSM